MRRRLLPALVLTVMAVGSVGYLELHRASLGFYESSVGAPAEFGPTVHPYPNRPRLLAYEIALVVEGHFGRGPLRVSTSNGLFPTAGFEEGLARDPRGRFTTFGFLSWTSWEAPEGSFVHWLVKTRGVAAVEPAFRAGDLHRPTGSRTS